MFKKICHAWCNDTHSLGLLIIRLGIGAVFLFHGIQKLSNMEMTVMFFGTIGIGAFFTWVVALVETIGGIALIFGLFTKPFAFLFAIIMLVAIFKVKWSLGFMAFELDFVLLIASLGLVTAGGGSYSLERLLPKCACNPNGCCK